MNLLFVDFEWIECFFQDALNERLSFERMWHLPANPSELAGPEGHRRLWGPKVALCSDVASQVRAKTPIPASPIDGRVVISVIVRSTAG